MALVIATLAVMVGCGDDESTTRTTPTSSPPATTGSTTPAPRAPVRLGTVVQGLADPVQTIGFAGSDELWVVERAGRIRRVVDGEVAAAPILDISDRVRSGGEQGLLSVALHPDLPGDQRVYIHYSDRNGDTRVEQLRAFADEPGVTEAAERTMLEVDQPFANHNGGSLAFGPDGKLYLGLGDGGSANDPEGNGQDLDSRLGKLLRLDVDDPAADWEIAAYGLRNPWRFSFDRATGDAWIGDVGQNQWEEVDVFPRGSGLLNYGWDVYEGRDESAADDRSALNSAGELTPPVLQYDHDEGCSITGGVVVRNPALGDLDGRYLYGDFCSGTIWSVPATGPFTPRKEPFSVADLTSIDATSDGAVFLTSLAGSISRLAVE